MLTKLFYCYWVESFSHQRWLTVFLWCLTDNKSLQVSKTLLNIMTDLNNAVIWMVSTFPLISTSSSPLTNPLGIVPSALITISITVTFLLHSLFFQFSRKVCLVSWGCRIYWLHLCRGVRLPRHECPGYDTKQSDGEVPVMLELLGNVEHPFITIAPRSTLTRSGSTW